MIKFIILFNWPGLEGKLKQQQQKQKKTEEKKKRKTSTIENGDYPSNFFFLKKYGGWERYGSLSVNMEGKCKWNMRGGARASRGMPKATDC